MVDPLSVFPADLLALVFTFLNFRVINLAKRFHTNPETVYAFFSVMVGLIYAVITTPPSFDSWLGIGEYVMGFGSKVSLIGLATSGVWHRYKKLTGQTQHERADDVATGFAAGMAVSDNTEKKEVEIEVQVQ